MSKAADLFRTLADSLDAGEQSLSWEAAEALQSMAEETGDKAYARAARTLHQLTGGRPPIDDSKAIAEAVNLYETGAVPSMNRAFGRVARGLNPYGNRRATAERLRRKCPPMNKASTK